MQGNRRRDGIDAYAELGGLECAAARQRHHPGFRGGVVSLFLLCPPAEHRSVVDDRPAATPLHVRQHGARHAKGPGKGDIQHPRPFLVAHLDHALLATEAGVVDQHVDSAQSLLGRGDQRLDLFLNGHVAQLAVDRLEAGFSLELFHGLFQATGMDVRNHQRPAAFFGTAARRGIADAGTRGSGDQNGFASQQLVARHIGRSLSHDVDLRNEQP